MPKPIGYHRNRRLKRLETKQQAANTNNYANTERENECQICYEKLTKKTAKNSIVVTTAIARNVFGNGPVNQAWRRRLSVHRLRIPFLYSQYFTIIQQCFIVQYVAQSIRILYHKNQMNAKNTHYLKNNSKATFW